MNKLIILFTWVRINLKFLLFSRFFRFTKETICGYTIHGFDYATIRFLFEEIFYRNEYFFDSDNEKPVILDCGANIGFATIFFKWLYPESEIYAFEPDKRTFELLKKNVSQNGLRNVHLFNSAISTKNGRIPFFIDSKNPGSLVMSTKQERMPKDRITVDCISLSSFVKKEKIRRIDYAKIDIEGSEEEVIQDLSRKNVLKRISRLCIEYHHKIGGCRSDLSTFLRVLEKNGFEYQIDVRCVPIHSENRFQDVLLYIYRE